MRKKSVFRISWLVLVIVMGVFVTNSANADIASWPRRHNRHLGPWPDKPKPKSNKPRPRKPKPRPWPWDPMLPKDVPDDPVKLQKLMQDSDWKKKIRKWPRLWERIRLKVMHWHLTWYRRRWW